MCRRVSYDDGTAEMWGDTRRGDFVALEGGNDSGIELIYTFDKNKKLTGVVANIPHNEDKALQVDKNAVYISSADVIADDNGTWNSSSLYVDKNYKTEGKASIHKELDYTDKIETGELSYLFDLTVDMSDLKTLKFDFFIDFPEFIQKSGNEFEIIIGQDRFLNDDYYSWNMELSTLKQGWNSLEFSLSNVKKIGNLDLTKAKIIMFRFGNLNLAADKFESIVYGFDNLRYISSSGNTILKVEGWDENSKQSDEESNEDSKQSDEEYKQSDEEYKQSDEESNEDYTPNTDNNDYSDVIFSETNEKQTVEKIVNITGKTKIIKSIDKITVMDYLTSGIILGVESVVLVVVSIIFLKVYKRRKKKKAL